MFRETVVKTAAAVATAGLMVIGVGCAPSSEDVVAGETRDHTGPLAPHAIAAGDNVGWLLNGSTESMQLLRVDSSGGRERVLSFSGNAAHLVAVDQMAVVAYAACAGDGCSSAAGQIVTVDERGREVGRVTAWTSDLPLQDSDALPIVGVVDDMVWLDTGIELVAYSAASARISDRVARPEGATCIIDGELFAARADTVDAVVGEPVAGAVPAPVVPHFEGDTPVVVARYDGSEWVDVSTSATSLPYAEALQTDCVNHGFTSGEIGGGGRYWRPGQSSWSNVPATDGLAVTLGSDSSVFRLSPAGTVDSVGPDGESTPRRLSFAVTEDMSDIGTLFMFDASSTIEIGCVQAPFAESAACDIEVVG